MCYTFFATLIFAIDVALLRTHSGQQVAKKDNAGGCNTGKRLRHYHHDKSLQPGERKRFTTHAVQHSNMKPRFALQLMSSRVLQYVIPQPEHHTPLFCHDSSLD